MSLPAPPDDPAELAEFPVRAVPADYPYARIHHDRHEPEWFCDKGDCRFDPPPGADFGTCYLAGHPLGAFVEKFGRLRVVPRSIVDQHALAQSRLTSPIQVADVTDRTILGRWHLTAELWAGDDYTGSQRWATACTKLASPASGTRQPTTCAAISTALPSSASPATSLTQSSATATTKFHSHSLKTPPRRLAPKSFRARRCSGTPGTFGCSQAATITVVPSAARSAPSCAADRTVNSNRLRLATVTAVLQVGVTGGVGSGKSTVAGMLAERGAVVIHADAIVAETRQPGGPAYADIVDRFGTAVVARDGTLDRRALAEIGNDEAARARIAAQISRDERLAVADIVIDNSGSIEELAAQVEPLWAWLGELRTTLR